MVSQKYGVKVQKLMVKNRLEQESDIQPGMVLWLRYIRSADQPVEYVQLPTPVEEPSAVVMESGNTGSAEVQDLPAISEQAWPAYNEEYLVVDEVEYVLQINGKIRDKMICSKSVDKSEVEQLAIEYGRIPQLLKGKSIVKVIVVPSKLVNIVAR